MAKLEEIPTDGVDIVLLPQDSRIASLVSPVEQLEQMDTGHTASPDVIVDLGEYAEYVLFAVQVGAAEWTRDPEAREDNYDLFVEVKVDGASKALRTMYTKTSHWDEDFKIAGYLSSIIRIEIKGVAHNDSESISIARAVTSLKNLLESCADSDAAALELTIVPQMPDMREHVAVTDVGKDSKHFTPGSMGLITVKLSRPPHTPPSLPQLPGIYTDPKQQTDELEERSTPVEIPPPPQDSKASSPIASLQQSEQLGTENLVSTNAVTAVSDKWSNFLLFVGAAEWTRDPGAREDNYDLFVEVKVNGANEVLRTMHTKTAHWDEYLKITGRLSSIVRIEIRSVAHNSSESLSVVRVETSLGNLLELCTDGDVAALELAFAPLVSGMDDCAARMGDHMGSKHSATDSIGLLTVKLCRLSHEPPNILQLRPIPAVSVPHASQLERGIPEEVEERGEMDHDISAIAGQSQKISIP
ncbi:hypothetical protein FIBSPDRAFT_454910 [Athelia psychrophila]|uniref:C2 domain-containing protein n=1 Tax=Athelia psychrophila TaxID=1759441 RepID=A0A167UAG2_9AGAM|nr:hypothetical protein FIBSPDRAFT_454910 [Fibularhizoctonia sp. CBS 109695]